MYLLFFCTVPVIDLVVFCVKATLPPPPHQTAIGVRLTNNVLKSIEFENVQTRNGTDSTTVLSWIQKVIGESLFGTE